MPGRFAIIAGISLLAAQPALACSCRCEGPDAAQTMIDGAAYVFSGAVVSRQTAKDPDQADPAGDPIRMKVSRILKGAAASELTVYSPSNSAVCGVSWQSGDTEHVIAYRNADGKLSVGLCGQTCAAKDGVFALLEKEGRPVK